MKTRVLLSCLLLSFCLVLINCAGKSSDSVSSKTTATYYQSGGSCYNSAGTSVASTYCSSSTYYMNNGICYSSGGTVVATSACTTTGYAMTNGYCYNGTGQIVSSTLCSSTGYYMNNGSCYSSSGQVVTAAYCSSTATSSVSSTMQCQGYYYESSNYGTQMVYCSMSNCRGYTLQQLTTGQRVVCQ